MKEKVSQKETDIFYTRVDQMTPFRPDFDTRILDDLKEKAATLLSRSTALGSSFRGLSASSLSRLVIGVSCYYTNALEGNFTTAIEIERALSSPRRASESKDIKELTKAHIDASLWAKENPAKLGEGRLTEWVKEAHDRLYTSDLEKECVPGQLRDYEVEVGTHLGVHSASLPTFMEKLDKEYKIAPEKPLASLIDAMCLHHRLMWTHPFGDGNGRVGRLLLQSCLEQIVPGAQLWSISRGYARDNAGETYKAALSNADMPRNGDFDGRGNLSSRQLAAFVDFSLECALDQVKFMSQTLDLEHMQERIKTTLSILEGPDKGSIMSKMYTSCMLAGQKNRGDLIAESGMPERTARNHLSQLIKTGFLKSLSEKGAVYAALPVPALGYLVPNLYPMAALPSLSKENLLQTRELDGLSRIQRATENPKS